jgi:hypothetical protein
MFRAAELFGGVCGSDESAFAKTRSFRNGELEVAYRRHLWSPNDQGLTCCDEVLQGKDTRRIMLKLLLVRNVKATFDRL